MRKLVLLALLLSTPAHADMTKGIQVRPIRAMHPEIRWAVS